MIRIEGLRLTLDQTVEDLPGIVSKLLRRPVSSFRMELVRKSLDARKKANIHWLCHADVETQHETSLLTQRYPGQVRVKKTIPYRYEIPEILGREPDHPPLIVGSGPCGLFAAYVLATAGLKPVILEQGKPVKDRISDVDDFMRDGKLNPLSNIQFGEGGAGTFSDGKLYTLISDPRTGFVYRTFVESGAPEEIVYDAKPHIGTDNLRKVIPKLRDEIINRGGIFRFGAKMTDVRIRDGEVHLILVNDEEEIPVSRLILAIGHSSRETVRMLHERGMRMEAKPFSMGARIEHKQEWIDGMQYGSATGHPGLPTGKYKLAVHLNSGRSVYTFCMCPGGTVVPGATEEGIVTNGMSLYAQNGENANSALLVNVMPEDFGSPHPLAGIDFQEQWERRAFQNSPHAFHAPVQCVEDFLAGRVTKALGEVIPTYLPGTHPADLHAFLPDFVSQSLREALPLLDRKMKGFAHPKAVLTGIETRSSSPVRIIRDDYASNIRGIYPAGEGAGYAGGIVSSAVDGIRIAEAVIESLG